MKDTLKSILHGPATLLATVLVVTGHASADPVRHTVQDSLDCDRHTVQDCIKIPDEEPPNKDHWLLHEPTTLGSDFGAERGHPHLALSPSSEPIERVVPAGPDFDPVALPAAKLPGLALRAPIDEPGGHMLFPTAGAQLPGPGALPLLGLGALALIGRRRRA